MASLGLGLFASQNAISSIFENIIPKENQLSGKIVVTCPPGLITYVDENCEVELEVEIPFSNCNITSMSYSVDGGPVIIVPPGTNGPILIGTFSPDTFNIIWNVMDDCIPPITAECVQPIFIMDSIPPIIICPDDIIITNSNDGRRNVLISIPQPDISDNCGVLFFINDYNNTDDASDIYPVGITPVIWTVTDIYGNTASCTMTVEVIDVLPPTLVCPDTLFTTCTESSPYEYYLQYTAAGGSATDETELDTSTFGWVEDIDTSLSCPDTIVRFYRIADTNGNFDTCSQILIVYDTLAPTAICKDVSVNLDANGQVTITIDSIENGSFDNCAGPLTYTTNLPLTFGCNDVLLDSSQVDIILTVTDQCGNSATCISTVTVLDLIFPTITCPPNVTVNAAEDQCYATGVVLGNPVVSDNCIIAITVARFMGNVVTLSTQFPVGSNNVIWTVTDIGGNTTTCIQTVIVEDNQSPEITCPANITVNTTAGLCSAIVNYQVPIGTDNCPSPITTQTIGIASGGVFPIGTTTNTFVVTDQSGATASCSFTVTVVDNQPPTISCPANITVNTTPGQCNALVNYTAPIGTDNCPGATTTQTTGLASGVVYPIGVTINTFVVTANNGQTASCSFTVTVIDNQPPTISCPANVTANTDANQCSAVVNYVTPIGIDNCLGATTVRTSGLPSGSAFPVGTTTITFVVTASNGQTASCSFTVTVIDNQPPTISCPPNITVNTTPGLCSALVSYATPVGTDNCSGATTTQTVGLASGVVYPVGVTTNTFVVTASNGQTASCSFTVTVIDNQPPTISCPANLTVNTDLNLCRAVVNYVAPVGVDNCQGATTVQTVGLPSGSIFPIGTTINTFVVTSSNGQTASCSFTITVVDNQPPTISCPANITVNATAGLCSAMVNYTAPIGTDNCSGATTTQTTGLASGASYPVGVTTNTFVVTASNGQTASCSFTVRVIDNQPPTIACPANRTVNTDINLCSAIVNYTAPIGVDNCPGATTVRISGLPSGSAFPVGTTTNTFVVTDQSGATASCSFTITVVDNQNPTISCPSNITVALNNSCQLVIPDLSALVIRNDNCPSTTFSQSPVVGTIINSSHNQVHVVTFIVTDAAGATATCNTNITSIDNLGPDITCEGFRVISISDLPEVPASSFVISATDNCGGPLTYSVRRMGTACGTNIPDDFGNYVNFCCDDVNDTITVVVRVTDSRGNFTECMNLVAVQDKLAPSLVIDSLLPDISVSCGYLLNLNNLSAFGTFVQQGTTRKNIVINDPGNPFYPTGIAGRDGVFTDNCPGAVVTITSRNLLTMCNTGEIKRDFVITDIGGNTATHTQTIYVIDVDKFDVNDITWPAATVNYNNCNDSDPDVSITGEPILRTDICNLVAATYKDQVFSNPNNCGFIKRTWTVIDWCQYETNNPGGPGKWTFVQSILITNSVAPVIAPKVCRDTIICTGNICDATVTFNATGTDDCLPVSITWTHKIDLDNNGSVDVTGVGSTITRKYNIGKHKMSWEAKDRCGNVSTCSFLFTIRDCKAPSVVALHGLAINLLPPSGRATTRAKFFNKSSSDNCTSAPLLRYSFSSNVNDTLRHFTCDSLGQRRIDLWATDLAGNQSSAITYILVQDNTDICGFGNKVNIKGHVYTEENVKVADTKVSIDGGETENDLMTDVEGQYLFSDLAKYNSYELLPVKDTDHGQGITTLDLVLIQRHILGIKYIESPYKLIAADVNNSQSISAADLVELRKLILGVQSKFSKNTSWRFVDASYVFNDKTHPWPFVEKLQYEELSTSMENSDFIGIKIGDVNGTVSQNIQGIPVVRSKEKLNLFIEEMDAAAKELITIPVKIDHLDQFIGMQWTLELSADMEYIGFESVDLPLKNDHLALIEKKGKKYLTLSYDDMNGISLPDGSVLFNIIGRPLKNAKTSQLVWINDAPLKAEAYTIDDITAEVELTYRSQVTEGVSFIMQNHPNPFKDETVFHFSLQEKSPVVFTVYDATGSEVYKSNEQYSEGNHSMTLTANQLGNRYGIFICKIKSKNIDQIIKILRIE